MGKTDFLFAKPSFVEGVSRVIDLGGTMSEYNRSFTPAEADKRAIASDFKMVGEDIKNAIDKNKR